MTVLALALSILVASFVVEEVRVGKGLRPAAPLHAVERDGSRVGRGRP